MKIKTLKNNGKIIITICLAVLLAAVCGLFGYGTATAESGGYTYVALGDSITTGYRLETAETHGFVARLETSLGKTALNAGIDGQTSGELLSALDSASETYAEYSAAIKSSHVITLTIGGNDLLADFYAFIAEVYNAEKGTSYTADGIKDILANPTRLKNIITALNILNMLKNNDYSQALCNSDSFNAAIAEAVSNINEITAAIKEINADAVILVANQYNPYQWISSDYQNIINLFETGVSNYNAALSGGASGDYIVVDISSAFSASETTLTNADISANDFDNHPNEEGHAVIAGVMEVAYEEASASDGLSTSAKKLIIMFSVALAVCFAAGIWANIKKKRK